MGGPLNGCVREPPVWRQVDETHVLQGERALVAFTGSDYLRMSWHPEVRRAAVRGVEKWGTGACASRMTTGNVPVYAELERALAGLFGVRCATLTSAGYTAPLVVAQALAEDHDLVLLDSRAHGCLRDAALLTGLPVVVFEHGEPGDLESRVRGLAGRKRALVLCDGLGAVDGMVSPVAAYVQVLGERGTLVVDDAHGAGVLGAKGRGTVEWSGVPLGRVVVTFTLSKAFGCYGGVVLGDRRVRERILERSRMFTGNTPPAPPSAEAALEAVRVLARDGASLRARLRDRVGRIPESVRAWGRARGAGPGPIFAVAPSSDVVARRMSRRLVAAGIHSPLIRYPNGPARQFFRFAISSAHSEQQVGVLAAVLGEFLGEEQGRLR